MKIDGKVAIITGAARGIGRSLAEAILAKGGKVGVFSSTKDTFGQIDIVINNAGGVRESDWEWTIQLNLIATYRGTDLAFEFMGRDKGGAGGVVISLASIAGLMPFYSVPSYSAAKHGVVGMTKVLGTPEHAVKGVRVNCVCPWLVDTPLAASDALKESSFPDAMDQHYEETKSTLIKPETIARATIELIEDDSKNGSVLEVQQDSTFAYVDYRKLPETAE